MASDISLTKGQRNTLVSLRETRQLITRTQSRLASGKRVNDVTDGPAAFFSSRALSNRSQLFLERKDEVDQGIETLRAALNGLDALIDLVDNMRGIIAQARAQLSLESRTISTEGFNELGVQFLNLVRDTSYGGLNLLNNDNSRLQVNFSDDTDSRLEVEARDLLADTGAFEGIIDFDTIRSTTNNFFSLVTAAVPGVTADIGFSLLGANLSATSPIDPIVEFLRAAELRLEDRQRELGTRIGILQQRSDFSQNYATTLAGGSDLLTLADLNEESANFTALRTNNQFGTQSLALESQISASLIGVLAS